MAIFLQTEEFRALPTPSLGLLVGLKLPRATGNGGPSRVVLGRCGCLQTKPDLPALSSRGLATPNWAESWERVRGCFPGGCDVCGVCIGVEGDGEEVLRELMKKTDLLDVVGERPVLVVRSERLQAYEVGELGSLEEVGVVSVGDYLSSHTCVLRVSSSLPAVVSTPQATPDHLLARLSSRAPAFLLPSFPLLLPHPSHSVKSPHNTLRQLLKASAVGQEPFLPVELLEVPSDSAEPLTLSISDPLSSGAELHLPVDTLALLHLDLSLEEVGTALWAAVQRQLKAVASAMLQPGSLHNVAIHHFPASSLHLCPLSIPYPHSPVAEPATHLNDSALVAVRKLWHTALDLPSDLPRLRLTNTHCFSPPRCHGPQLLCPHSTLSYFPQGTVAMVMGEYAYYHYQQDSLNDTGWGCAYRSLQTLWSWFNQQGFTTEAPPTHQQIQEALVATGDKPARFVGSQEWIGSFEVNTTLNHLLGVECRIHHVSSGGEMSGVGRVLLHHFNSEGTPVMIGGGVLAHTILGVDYNTSSGAIKFLILDPHYTGREDLKTILNKGWCGWKSLSFWDKKAHYNMCLPLRPREI